MKKILVLLFICFGLFGCENEPMKFDNPNKFCNNTQYFADWKGNCFAIVGVRQTGRATMNGVGFTLVPTINCR